MRNTFLFLAVFLPSILLAQGPALKELNLLCITEFPTTSFVGFSGAGKIDIRFVNSNGVGYMPIHSGLITINDIELLKKRAEVLKNIPDVNEFSFDLKNCEVYQDQTFRCANGTSFKGKDGKEMIPFSLSSIKHKKTFSDFRYEETEIMLGLEIDKENYFINMTYAPHECGLDFKR